MSYRLNYQFHISYRSEHLDRYCHVIPMPDTWVSNALRDELPKWCCRRPVVISAPTGRGKTSFVADIVKFCWRTTPGRRVLLLVNRTAIANQQKRELARKLHSKWGRVKDLEAFELNDDFDDIELTVMTFQRFAARRAKMDLKCFEWVIFDESHYFGADSCFNQHLDSLFWELPDLFGKAQRIFMSATPEEVLRCLHKAESKNLSRSDCCPEFCCGYDERGKILLYSFPKCFKQVELRYYREVDEVVKLVQRHPEDKFLIFTAAREKDNPTSARSYVRALTSAGIEVDYLDRFCKESDTWKLVCEEGRFAAQVLVCTSVLDCGVSLNDKALRHVVVEATDRTEFIQMIGRRRLNANERLTVYLRVPARGVVCSRLNDVNGDLAVLGEGFNARKIGRFDNLIYRGWNDEDEECCYRRLLNYSGNGQVSPKMTAYHHLKWQKATLKRILDDSERLGDDSALPRMAHEWLDQPDAYDPSRWLDYDTKAESREQIITFLAESEGVPVAAREWGDFSKKLLALVQIIQRFPHDDKRIRKPSTVSKRLREIGIPFEISAEGTGQEMVCKVKRLQEVEQYG